MKNYKWYLLLFLGFGAIHFLFAQGDVLNTSDTNDSFHLKPKTEKSAVNWGDAKWIGYIKDDRSEKWSYRALRRNQPPMNINLWEPTEEDLKVSRRKTHPSVLLRRFFSVSKEIDSAIVTVCGLGLHELYLNGEKVSNQVLSPAQTSYDKHAFYVTHNITASLKQNNSLGIILGNGFYGQNMAFSPGLSYGKPRAILVLDIVYRDGTKEKIVTNDKWKAHSSPILFDNIYLGETYDARQEIKDWCRPNFNDARWDAVEVMKAPTHNLIEQQLEPMRKVRSVDPVAILPAENGWILDMGQNITGWLAISVKEAKGTVVKMRFAEHVMPDHQNIDPASTGIHVTGNTQTDIYICKGGQLETWEPRFTYHGFRYVQIEGLSKKPNLNQFTGWLVRTDAKRIGTFKSSDSLVNTFYEVSMWTIEDNIQGILSDCPHRERCAWMGDAYVVAEASSYNFDLKRLWQKTSSDTKTVLGVSKAHFKDPFPYDLRAPSNISVGKRLCLQARPDWGAATVMVPWFSYVYYGDKTIIENAWDMMVGWMEYLDKKVQEDGIINGGFGDWCPPGGNPEMDTPPALTSTALYYQSLVSMHKMAVVLGRKDTARDYGEKAKMVKKAFNYTFFNKADNSYGSQTGNAFALHTGLVPQGLEQLVADDLAQRIMQDKNGHYSTGIFGHRPLYTVLNDYGHDEVTKHLWSITHYPSLGFMTQEHDLTTWPEHLANWNKGERYYRNSFNHPMQSGFAAVFHESLGGIRPHEDFPGFEKFILRPTFVKDIDWVEVSHRSPRGQIESSWKQNNGQIEWLVTVPETSTAIVQLPHHKDKQILLNNDSVSTNTFKLKSGNHKINITQ